MSVDKFFEITDDIRLSADRFQFIIMMRRVVEDKNSKNFGESFWDAEAYLPQIKDVIHYLAEMGIREHIDDMYAAFDWVTHLENKFDVFEAAKQHRENLK